MKTLTPVTARHRFEYHYNAPPGARPSSTMPRTAKRVLMFIRTHQRSTRNEIKRGVRLTYGRVCTALDRLLRDGLVRA